MKQRKICKICEEDLLCRTIIGVIEDHTADYSGDLAEFPLRTLGGEILALRSNFTTIEAPLLACFNLNVLGIIICFRKAKIYTSTVYEHILTILDIRSNEDIITEACHYLIKYPLKPDALLAEKIGNLINDSDSLSTFIKYAIKILENLLSLDCALPKNLQKIYSLFVHNLTEVRISTLSAFAGLVQKNATHIETVFLLTSQILLLETNSKVLKQA